MYIFLPRCRGEELDYHSLNLFSLILSQALKSNISRNGSISVGGYLSHPCEALLEAINSSSVRFAWAKGLAARTPS
jgi:hypothetical protein